ncbi:uncharacterized protein LOC121589349 [Anopheles merus]|uniref:uncharacterized protein LOC121589349 n=1 Tax=Anopheles merus TaxID=30066 RepID=UPI001BE4BD69|nr:uncharacterized protein LOC121589349 [Anopheles merus]
MLAVLSIALSDGDAPEHDVVKSRQKRIVFPLNAAIGIIFAIAVPLGIPSRNIFMSYNFEGNYNSPQDANVFTEGFGNYLFLPSDKRYRGTTHRTIRPGRAVWY